MQLVCEECRDWPITKRKVFVNYNNKLRTKREYKQRQARLAGAASDQSVYETDTDVPLDEPSVPVPNVHLDDLNLGQQQCLISEEVVVSAGPSTETATSDLLLLPPGSDLDKLALTILSRLSDLQSAREPQTPVQSQSMTSGLSQQAVILPNVCQPSVQSLSAGSTISQQGIILPNVCQPSVQAGSGISQPGVILPNVCQPVFTNTEVAGVTAPLHCFLTLPNQFSGSPRRPYLEGSSTKPLRGLSEAAREAARDFSLYRGAQSRPSTSSGSNQRRQFNSSNPRVVTIRLLGPHRIALRHHLLQGASSRRRNPPIPPGNVGVFGSRSLSPRPA